VPDAQPPSEPATPVLLADPTVTVALDRLHHAEVAVVEAKQAVDDARARLTQALFDAAAPYRRGDQPLPPGELATLYWERTDLRTTDLAKVFGLTSSRLAGLAGPRLVEQACYRCGAASQALRTTRSDRSPALCIICRDEKHNRERREHERELARIEAGDPWDGGPPSAPPRPYAVPY
jgi:hypothetical protein